MFGRKAGSTLLPEPPGTGGLSLDINVLVSLFPGTGSGSGSEWKRQCPYIYIFIYLYIYMSPSHVIVIRPSIRIGPEIWCLPYAGF